jgi:hypothetical protein
LSLESWVFGTAAVEATRDCFITSHATDVSSFLRGIRLLEVQGSKSKVRLKSQTARFRSKRLRRIRPRAGRLTTRTKTSLMKPLKQSQCIGTAEFSPGRKPGDQPHPNSRAPARGRQCFGLSDRGRPARTERAARKPPTPTPRPFILAVGF